jgi:hypothetical protein
MYRNDPRTLFEPLLNVERCFALSWDCARDAILLTTTLAAVISTLPLFHLMHSEWPSSKESGTSGFNYWPM